ncbi:23S rRNA pseudouridylate synthase B, partial [Pseudomonas aeruginosa]
KGREQGTPVAERPRESNRKPQVKRRPKPAGDGMRPGFRR